MKIVNLTSAFLLLLGAVVLIHQNYEITKMTALFLAGLAGASIWEASIKDK